MNEENFNKTATESKASIENLAVEIHALQKENAELKQKIKFLENEIINCS